MKNQSLIGLGILAIILAITNPSLEDHKAKVKQQVTQAIGLEQQALEMANSEDSFESAGLAIGSALGMTLMEKMVDGAVTSDNYIFFSFTKGTWEGQENTIGVGALGNIYLFKNVKDLQEDPTMQEVEDVKNESGF